jgi:hypothetical protein
MSAARNGSHRRPAALEVTVMAEPRRYPPASTQFCALAVVALASELVLVAAPLTTGTLLSQVLKGSALLGFLPLLVLALAYVLQ